MDRPELIRISNTTPETAEITARLPSKEALKSMFTLLVGNPDSMVKTFNKAMIIDKSDIDKLDEQICNKLGIHQIEGSKTTFDLTLSDNTVLEFERWREADINLASPHHVNTVAVRWDFMVRLPNYDLPQRHVLTVRIGEGRVTMPRLMQAAFSRDPEELDRFELNQSPLYCRVDFINQILSQELVNTVDDWHKGRRDATGPLPTGLCNPWIRRVLHYFLTYSVPLWAGVVALLWLLRSFATDRLLQPVLVHDLRDALAWIFVSAFAIVLLCIASKYLAETIQVLIIRCTPHTQFFLTSGDTNRHEKQKRKAMIKVVKYGLGFVAALICNVVAAYIAARLFSAK